MWAWLLLLVISAALATAAQYISFRHDRRLADSDCGYIAGSALLGGFTAHVWYPGFGPVVDGFNLVPALLGAVVVAVVVEVIYRSFIRPRQTV